MSEKIYLYLLLFCGILWQGIFAKFSDEDNRLSSDVLLRKKRVINHLPNGRDLARINTFNYIVKIKESGRPVCAGVILSHYSVITAAPCIHRDILNYKIFSGAAYDSRSNSHSVTSIAKYFGTLPHKSIDGIALITIDPPFVYSRSTGSIHLHIGPLPAGTMANVVGWGHSYPIQPGLETRMRLHSMTLPIINQEECENIYRNNSNHFNLRNAVAVTEKHICTYCEQQYCARGDAGAPLVVHNLLVGIHVWKGEFPDRRNPDVYINLQRADYRDWINENSLLM